MIPASKKPYLIDTNILIYGLDRSSPFYQKTVAVFDQIEKKELSPVLCQQNILEAQAVLIHVYKETPQKALQHILNLADSYSIPILTPRTMTLSRYEKLIQSTGRNTDPFDIYLAATILDQGISSILTANAKDFKNIPGIHVTNPYETER